MIVVVDGLIGSGKSTILKGLKDRGYKVENQRIGEWSLLKLFYKIQVWNLYKCLFCHRQYK